MQTPPPPPPPQRKTMLNRHALSACNPPLHKRLESTGPSASPPRIIRSDPSSRRFFFFFFFPPKGKSPPSSFEISRQSYGILSPHPQEAENRKWENSPQLFKSGEREDSRPRSGREHPRFRPPLSSLLYNTSPLLRVFSWERLLHDCPSPSPPTDIVRFSYFSLSLLLFFRVVFRGSKIWEEIERMESFLLWWDEDDVSMTRWF